jgi:hypothetical protein
MKLPGTRVIVFNVAAGIVTIAAVLAVVPLAAAYAAADAVHATLCVGDDLFA